MWCPLYKGGESNAFNLIADKIINWQNFNFREFFGFTKTYNYYLKIFCCIILKHFTSNKTNPIPHNHVHLKRNKTKPYGNTHTPSPYPRYPDERTTRGPFLSLRNYLHTVFIRAPRKRPKYMSGGFSKCLHPRGI